MTLCFKTFFCVKSQRLRTRLVCGHLAFFYTLNFKTTLVISKPRLAQLFVFLHGTVPNKSAYFNKPTPIPSPNMAMSLFWILRFKSATSLVKKPTFLLIASILSVFRPRALNVSLTR